MIITRLLKRRLIRNYFSKDIVNTCYNCGNGDKEKGMIMINLLQVKLVILSRYFNVRGRVI